MLYRFQQYTFDSTNLVLQQNGSDIDIRPYEAKLLAYLLENKDNVVSKQDILTNVWRDKIVAEQVIFQNISHLRALFGSTSIKTFPKRGYQWQLETEAVVSSPTPPLNSDDIQAKSKTPEKSESGVYRLKMTNRLSVFTIASVIFVGILMLMFRSQQVETSQSALVAVVPFKQQVELGVGDILDSMTIPHQVIDHIDADSFLTSSELLFTSLEGKYKAVISGEIREYKGQYYFDLLVTGNAGSWQGQIQGSNTIDIATKLNKHLANAVVIELVSSELSPSSRNALLTLAHQNAPNDAIILAQLIQQLIDERELDKAMVLSEKLASNGKRDENMQQLGIAYLLQSEILTLKEVYGLSREKLQIANEALKSVNDLKRQADLWEAQSWLDHQARDYEKITQSLLTSARLGLAADDKKRELHALTYLSVMGHKYSKTEDKYGYLQSAEAKMRDYNLPLYHFAKIPFHYAIFAQTPQEKEPHYKAVIEYTELIPDYWVAQSSRRSLLTRYIETQRLQEARDLVDSLTSDNAHNSYLRMLLARSENQPEQFAVIGQKAFEQAQFSGDKRLSLDIALLLCDAQELPRNFEFYSRYIRENASQGWLRANEDKLAVLKI